MSNQNDGVQAFQELEALAKAGKYGKALDKHLWFHEASKDFSGMGGVRLSYALDIWMELAEKYSPAKEALIKLRNNNKEILLKGNGSFENFHDLSAINRTLGEKEDTLIVFIEIHNIYPKQAKNYYHVVEELVVEKKAYDICAKYITDPIKKFSQIQHIHEMNVDLMKKDCAMDNDDFKKYTKESYVKEVCQLIEIMSALEKNNIAVEIQKQALEYLDNDVIRGVISS